MIGRSDKIREDPFTPVCLATSAMTCALRLSLRASSKADTCLAIHDEGRRDVQESLIEEKCCPGAGMNGREVIVRARTHARKASNAVRVHSIVPSRVQGLVTGGHVRREVQHKRRNSVAFGQAGNSDARYSAYSRIMFMCNWAEKRVQITWLPYTWRNCEQHL